jgi:transglutaminase-like putative cysteine protease
MLSSHPSATISVATELVYDIETPTTFAFAVAAARNDRQRVIDEGLELTPSLEPVIEPYGEGGTHQLVRFDAEPGELVLRYRAVVEVAPPRADPSNRTEVDFGSVPADLLPYLNPSRYCESDRMVDLAERLVGDVEPGGARVEAVSQWVRDELTYEFGSTDGSSSAADVLLQRAGVCRDFAHVAIALCRALGIPARYVSAYGIGVEPQDFHGVFEAYLSGSWWLFDPTGMTSPHGLVRIAVGRDAADASFATFAGTASLVDKSVSVAPVVSAANA